MTTSDKHVPEKLFFLLPLRESKHILIKNMATARATNELC
jgi:hypothetical protein